VKILEYDILQKMIVPLDHPHWRSFFLMIAPEKGSGAKLLQLACLNGILLVFPYPAVFHGLYKAVADM
jgi:hypothetical protein